MEHPTEAAPGDERVYRAADPAPDDTDDPAGTDAPSPDDDSEPTRSE
ncbi:hypothetical protein [Pseudonocardia sp. MH-G8]|nr:hypothetical protein [Pseudonocardia sp. MH-G8]